MPMNEYNLILIADSSDAIRNAFQKIFGKYHNMVMSWPHMRKCLIKKLCLIKHRDLHYEIMYDLDALQLLKYSIIFKIATNLYQKSGKVKKDSLNIFQANG